MFQDIAVPRSPSSGPCSKRLDSPVCQGWHSVSRRQREWQHRPSCRGAAARATTEEGGRKK